MNDSNDVKSAIVFIIRGERVTADVLKNAMRDFLGKKTIKKGKMSYRDLVKQSTNGKLENIEITENNIGDFLKTARKYDVDFALKRDSSGEPPTYHVMFETRKADNFKRAFSEYSKSKTKEIAKKRGEINKEQFNEIVKVTKEKQAAADKERGRDKVRVKERGEMSR